MWSFGRYLCYVQWKTKWLLPKESTVEGSLIEQVPCGGHTEKDGASTDFVEGLQVSDGWGDGQVVWKFILQVGDQHPKLSAPVTHMIQPTTSKKQF